MPSVAVADVVAVIALGVVVLDVPATVVLNVVVVLNIVVESTNVVEKSMVVVALIVVTTCTTGCLTTETVNGPVLAAASPGSFCSCVRMV